ncbi:hypothetical protein HMPREF9554_01619 [Treponema phagedenis F0421]|uniref:chitobiase/beta-hexosaminidase C-terminal domain-containing protein n=1 Tax=Treponema phagedenis TaxID=162 RepID=UPI0001F63E96|nr:chitobiase/beta-hexosaminidase C-terminal domain-containing protein [Treponema phagedenis]EFW37897.1 hypothetical protein HMPREF9554_01619 [Treponema phagedenis F0421]
MNKARIKKISLLSFLFCVYLTGFTFAEESYSPVSVITEYEEQGAQLTLKMPSETKIEKAFYRLYNPVFNTFAEGRLGYSEPLYCPYGTEICIWKQKRDGSFSKALAYTVHPQQDAPLMEVISPQSGAWENEQYLIINAQKNTQIVYSIDGSDPEQFGLVYTEPVLIDKTGFINLRIKAIKPFRETEEKVIHYSAMRGQLPLPPYTTEKPFTFMKKDAGYRVLNWYFIELPLGENGVYLLGTEKENSWQTYTGPIFVPRDKDVLLSWYSDDKEKMQSVLLPKKPLINGVPEKPTNKPVLLQIEKTASPFIFYYQNSERFMPDDLKWTAAFFNPSGTLFDVAEEESKHFFLRIRAFYDGVPHGDITIHFEIDKIPPLKPLIRFEPDHSPSTKPVTITASSGAERERLLYTITPPVYIKKGEEIILTGKENAAVEYELSFYTQDEAGNTSSVLKYSFTVDKNTYYIDATAANGGDGSFQKPFTSFEEAFFTLAEKEKTDTPIRFSLKTGITVPESIVLNIPIIIDGNKNQIEFAPEAFLSVKDCSCELKNTRISRTSLPDSKLPLIQAENANLILKDCEINAAGGAATIQVTNSRIECNTVQIQQSKTDYAVCFQLKDSAAELHNVYLLCEGLIALGVSADSSFVQLDTFVANIEPQTVGRVIELWNSQIIIDKLSGKRIPEHKKNTDIALWYTKSSKVTVKTLPIFRGFQKGVQSSR